MIRVIALVGLLATATVGRADEKYLVPIVLPAPVPGAFESEWATEFSVHNASAGEIAVNLYRDCAFECAVQIPAGATVRGVPIFTPIPGKVGPGDFLFVSGPALENVRLSLRIRDLSRQHLTYGTEIPVVPVSEAHIGSVQLLSVPTDDRFRQMLRIYDFDSREGARAEVSFYTPNGTHLASREVELQTSSISGQREARPGYAEINWLSAEFPMISAFSEVRVQVRPLTPSLRYWALASITHNETQHVTIISPAVD